MARRYPEEVHAFIRENIAGRTARELTELVNARFGVDMTESRMKAYKKNHHLRSGTPCGKQRGSYSETFPREVAEYILANFPGVGHKEMADRLNVRFDANYTRAQIKSFYGNHKLDSGRTGRFEKGRVPANKGKTWDDFMSPEAQERSRTTCFKKGNIPHNGGAPIGEVRIRHPHKDRNAKPYVWEKVAQPNVWRMKHVLEWERHNGPVPKGCMVSFANGDTLNWHIENLFLQTPAQNAVKNRWGLHGYDKESSEAANKIADIKMALSRIRKEGVRRL